MLSQRLFSIRSFYEGSEVIWDIGCDHGDLGASFVGNKEVERIHLVDPSIEVIEKLKQKDSYITNAKIFIELKKGQEIQLEENKKHTIFIAGMGGTEILEILMALSGQLTERDTIIISPHRKILELRNELLNSHFRLKNETLIKENHQFYQILSLSLDQSFSQITHFGGLNLWNSRDGREYKQSQIFHFSKHRDDMSLRYVKFLKSII